MSNPTPFNPVMAMLRRHVAERNALLDTFELEVRNEKVGPFLRPSLEVMKELHGGCAALTSHPFTLVFTEGPTVCAMLCEKEDGKLGMDFLGRDPRVVGLSPEDARKMLGWAREHLTKSKSSMEPQLWSTDAAELYCTLHRRHLAELLPLIEEEKAAVRAVEVTP